MFGYITVNNEELKIKDYNLYRSCYCGLCRTLKKRHGIVAPLTLSYDMTFVVILLSALYEDPFREGSTRCVAHPAKKHVTRQNKWSDYAADMTILLAYHNMMDDWDDEKKIVSLTMAKTLEKQYKKIARQYPKQTEAVKEFIRKTTESEQKKDYDVDRVSGYTGEFLGSMFAKEDDIWHDALYKVGFYLGKFIYLMDAYDDLETDRKKKNFNLLLPISERKDFEAYVENTLLMMMTECSKNFELLPILQYTDILRNILYSGVWTKYAVIKKKRDQKDQKGTESNDF
ncbi:MAG: DUF5685 family protein [Lachnospiraceae bacterium]|nr:DUF5685 family protein [Lachnospiraceae bacterium]